MFLTFDDVSSATTFFFQVNDTIAVTSLALCYIVYYLIIFVFKKEKRKQKNKIKKKKEGINKVVNMHYFIYCTLCNSFFFFKKRD